jgi:hypothetical protein
MSKQEGPRWSVLFSPAVLTTLCCATMAGSRNSKVDTRHPQDERKEHAKRLCL